jgi:hypothetical protein
MNEINGAARLFRRPRECQNAITGVGDAIVAISLSISLVRWAKKGRQDQEWRCVCQSV